MAMATPRTLMRSSRLLSSRFCTATHATRPACRYIRGTPSQRLFTSSSRLREDVVSTPSRGNEVPLTSTTRTPADIVARVILLKKVPKRAVLSEIKQRLQSEALQATRFQLGLDRFTFHNTGQCYVEFSSEEEAQRALKVLHDAEFKNGRLRAEPAKDSFRWASNDGGPQSGEGASRSFVDEGSNASEALRPLIEGRRKRFMVQPPGWGPKNTTIGHNEKGRQVVNDHLSKFGIEVIGKMEPFYGDLLSRPRILCFIDFTTKDGADQAVANLDPEIEGRKVELLPVILAPWRAHQVGKVDAALLAELQEKGLAPEETFEDKFENSDRKTGAKNHNTTRIQREMKKQRAEKAKAEA